MANLKNITELPIAESAEGLNLIVNDNGHAKQIPASKMGSVQPDWNQNDETAPDYVKNRPFYEEATRTTFVSETTFTSSDGAARNVISCIDGVYISDFFDKEVIVTFDGKEYKTTVTKDGDECYWIEVDSDDCHISIYEGTTIYDADDGEHTIKVDAMVATVHELDEKYIKGLLHNNYGPFIGMTNTRANVAEKYVTISDDVNQLHPLRNGTFIIVSFATNNTADSMDLNINGIETHGVSMNGKYEGFSWSNWHGFVYYGLTWYLLF